MGEGRWQDVLPRMTLTVFSEAPGEAAAPRATYGTPGTPVVSPGWCLHVPPDNKTGIESAASSTRPPPSSRGVRSLPTQASVGSGRPGHRSPPSEPAGPKRQSSRPRALCPCTRRSGPGRRRRGRSGPVQGAASRLRLQGRALDPGRGSARFSAPSESA